MSQNSKNNLQSPQKTTQTQKSSKQVAKANASPMACGAKFQKGILKLKSLNFGLLQSKKDVFYEIKQVIQSILHKVNKAIEYKRGQYNLYADQTFGAIFNEPQITFQNSSLTRLSHLACHEEPKAKAYIDGSIGCVKIQDKNSSVCSGTSKNKKLGNKSHRRMSKSGLSGYVRSPRNSIKFKAMQSLNLSSIQQKKPSFSNSKSINVSVSDLIKKDLQETTDQQKNKATAQKTQNGNKRKSISGGDFFSLLKALAKPSKFTAITTEHNNDKDDDDHFINYLRYVKQDNESTGSNVFSFILNSLKPKQSSKEGGKVKSIGNYKLPKLDKIDQKQWMQGPDKTYETIKSSQIELLAKKQKRMSVFLMNKEQINKGIKKGKDKPKLIEKPKQEKKFSKADQKQNLNLMKQLETNQQQNNTQGKGKSFIYKKGLYKNGKQTIKFPSLYSRSQSKQLFHPICIDQSLVWLKGKEDQKEHEEKMNQFMAKNSQKCTLRVNYKQKTESVNEAKEKLGSISLPQQSNNVRKSRRLSLLVAR